MTTITIVTPWLDHPELVASYMHAVRQADDQDRLIVLDNGSHPPLELPPPAYVERMDGNEGFARACNAGLRLADSDAVLFLNNDVAMTSATWLDQIRLALKPGKLVGAQLRTDAHGQVDGRPLAYLDGWCVAGMRDDLVALGGWDEGYEEPCYFGDNDLSLRAKARGMRLVQVPVGLRHLGGVTRRDFDGIVPDVTARNRERFLGRARELLQVAA